MSIFEEIEELRKQPHNTYASSNLKLSQDDYNLMNELCTDNKITQSKLLGLAIRRLAKQVEEENTIVHLSGFSPVCSNCPGSVCTC